MLNLNHQVALATYLKDVARFLEHAQAQGNNSSKSVLNPILQSSVTDNLVNALPDICRAIDLSESDTTLLADIVKEMDYLALGLKDEFNDQSHETKGVNALFEKIHLEENPQEIEKGVWRYPLQPLSAKSIFPTKDLETSSYEKLWERLIEQAKKLPKGKMAGLLLDSFDTLWQNITHAVPMFGQEVVSLYDHSKIMAALSVALFAWHRENPKKEIETQEESPFVIIQGDFFGIQKFIFSTGSQSNKSAAKLLRGRSFQVSLFSELAALSVLEASGLPATSQILNAAGKFMIIAPNIEAVREGTARVKSEINEWFLANGFGQVSLGLSIQTAQKKDFESEHFETLIKQSFEALEVEKYRRFNLVNTNTPAVLEADYPYGICQYNQSFPAKKNGISDFSQDQIDLGNLLVKKEMTLIFSEKEDLPSNVGKALKVSIFGWKVIVTEAQVLEGNQEAVWAEKLLRCWDFSLPSLKTELPWNGFARRSINAYVPRFSPNDDDQRYLNVSKNEESDDFGTLKTFGHLACENRRPRESNSAQYIGKVALATLKGDVDNLGTIFQKGLVNPSLTKMTALSRYMTLFFSTWLPAFCAEKYPNVYTVFAGGDDFFMIGPWLDTQKLAFDMRENFTHYVAENPEITFSAGIAMTSADVPLPRLSEFAEEALTKAKRFSQVQGRGKDQKETEKNAITIYGKTISWTQYRELEEISWEINGIKSDYGMSTSYLYGLISVIDLMLDKSNIESGMWLSRYKYRTRRFTNDLKIDPSSKDQVYQYIDRFFVTNINTYQGAFKIPLFNHFYALRQR